MCGGLLRSRSVSWTASEEERMNPAGKVVVVTGAGSGMGREIALELVRRRARVAAVDINEATLRETTELAPGGADAMATFVVNITDRAAVEALPQAVVDRFGAVDGIVNCAGIIQPFVRLNDLDYAAIDRVFDVNWRGTLYMTKTFLPWLLRRPEAHVVNISSMGGFLPVPGQTIYGASKAAVKLLTEGLHSELRHTNVRVTVVFPGAVATNITVNSGVVMKMPAAGGGKQRKALAADRAASSSSTAWSRTTSGSSSVAIPSCSTGCTASTRSGRPRSSPAR
jgi:NAD(P)-dependent dehydrogenase (short-subunit alcohol dehydrogenase family)